MGDFYLDHNVSRRVAGPLEEQGHSVLTARSQAMDAALAMLRAAVGAAFNFSPPNQRYFLRIVELLLKATAVRHRTDSAAKTDINEGVMAILTGIGSKFGVQIPTAHVAQPPSPSPGEALPEALEGRGAPAPPTEDAG